MLSTSHLRSLAVAVLVAVIASLVPVRAAEPSALVAGAVEKLGGAKKLADIATVSIAARHKHWDPPETPEPDIGNRLGGESRFYALDGYREMDAPAPIGFVIASRP